MENFRRKAEIESRVVISHVSDVKQLPVFCCALTAF